mmetsp:Transcript_37279/g.98869  ORF Transcript_37279/g.98869 Transcript_37279/m.98869 type:complete len:204 (-) Transcript_37279:1228-1839(-)
MRVPCDAGADDDGRRNIELLAGEIDRLDGLDALQLVDGQGMAVDTQRGERLAAGQRLGEFLCSLCFELVAIEAQRDERLALGQRLGKFRCSFCIENVAIQTQGCDVALLDPLTQSSDALDGVGATTVLLATTEHVVVQTQRHQRRALGQHLGELRCSLWTEPVVTEVQGGQIWHSLDRCDERVQPFHISIVKDAGARQVELID